MKICYFSVWHTEGRDATASGHFRYHRNFTKPKPKASLKLNRNGSEPKVYQTYTNPIELRTFTDFSRVLRAFIKKRII